MKNPNVQQQNKPRAVVCPVAFNEHIKLKQVIERFLASPARAMCDLLVVDDGSTDETPHLLAAYAAQGVRCVRHNRRRGVGAAIRTAMKQAREDGYDIIVIMAGNNKDDPNEIPRLLQPIFEGKADFVQGSRYLQGGGIGGDMPLYRKWATRWHPWLMSRLTGHQVTDSTNGFRAYRLALLDDERIDVDQSWLDRYELEPYLMYKVLTLGYPYQEVPVTKIYPPKKLGYTKMKPIIGWWSMLKPLIYLGLGLKR